MRRKHGTNSSMRDQKKDMSIDDILRMRIRAKLCIQKHVFEPIELQARHIFLQDIIVLTPNSSAVSRGHFADLAAMLGSSSEVAYLQSAVNAVALTVLATRFNITEARSFAMSQYIRSVGLIRIHMKIPSTHRTEHLMAAISLLSLYEVLNADVIDSLNCVMHLRGIMAITRTRVSLRQQPASGIELSVLSTDRQQQCCRQPCVSATRESEGSSNQTEIDVSAPLPASPVALAFNELVSILPKLRPLRVETYALRSELLAWSSRQPEDVRPVTARRFTQPHSIFFPACRELACPTFRADRYADYLVANIWTSYRQCQLHLANLVGRIDRSLHKGRREYSKTREAEKLGKDVANLIDDICASMAFMLAGEDIQYSRTETAGLHVP